MADETNWNQDGIVWRFTGEAGNVGWSPKVFEGSLRAIVEKFWDEPTDEQWRYTVLRGVHRDLESLHQLIEDYRADTAVGDQR